MTILHPVSADDFASMDDDALASAVSTLAAHIHAATWRLLTLIAELDQPRVWAAQGALSCAHWLSWACGIDTHTAREKVRVARALTGLPLLSEALAKGELGYSKARALTRIATSENEADLLNIGLHGTAQHVEKFVRLYRRAKRARRPSGPMRSTRTAAHLLARGRRHRGAARAVPARDGRAAGDRLSPPCA